MLDIFDIKLTDKVPNLADGETIGIVAVQVRDAIQTVVDVLTDADTGKGWDVSFEPTMSAMTDRSARRHITITVKPLMDAHRDGLTVGQVAAIMTGFAVHEIGHTKIDFYDAVKRRWPGKDLPITLANIIEDVVLELQTTDRYPGFADHGSGDIFAPALEWVAKRTCPTYPLKWEGSTGHKVNVTGQVLRYRDYVSFESDAITTTAVQWVEQWASTITADLTPKGCVTLIEQWLDYVKANPDPKVETPEPPKPPERGGDEPGTDQRLPDEDDDEPTDTEGGNEPGGDDESEDSEDGGSEAPGPEGDEDEDGDDGEGGSDGTDSDTEGEPEGDSDDTEGEGKGTGRSGDGNDADTMDRVDADKGTNDGAGAGGSGQAVAEAGDEDPDAGFDKSEVIDSFDDTTKVNNTDYQQRLVDTYEAEERSSTRLNAGEHGSLKVVWK